MEEEVDVAIVGCGPVGATLANLLGREGIRVRVLERDTEIHPLPRAVHLDAEAMRVLQQVGCAEDMAKVSASLSDYRFVNAAGQTLMTMKMNSPTDQGWERNYMFHQPDLEALLRERLAEIEAVTVSLGHEVTSVTAGCDRASVSYVEPSGRPGELSASYVVGCDGARSIVRGAIGGGFHDLGLHTEWLVVDLLPNPGSEFDRHEAIQFCDPAGPSTYVPVGNDRLRWELMLLSEDRERDFSDVENVWSVLGSRVDRSQAGLERAAVYTFHSVVAERWRSGRVFIAGDAAHQTPPFLGQGLCTGIRDAANLYWKLAGVIDADASESLLDTYQSERESHARRFTEAAAEVGDVIQASGEAAAARDREMLAGGVPKELTQPAPPLGPGLHLGEGAAGTLAPQWTLNGRRGDDAIGSNFAAFARRDLLDAVQPATVEAWDRVGFAVRETHAEADRWLESHKATAAIIRPDRYVLAATRTAGELDEATAMVADALVEASRERRTPATKVSRS